MGNLKISEGNKGNLKRELIQSDKIKVGATINGYGVYCIKPIKRGEIIEECVVAAERIPNIANQFRVLETYRFRGVETIPGSQIYDYAIILGNAMLYNHSNNPNVDIKQNLNYERLIFICALRDINIGEELRFNYGYQPKQ